MDLIHNGQYDSGHLFAAAPVPAPVQDITEWCTLDTAARNRAGGCIIAGAEGEQHRLGETAVYRRIAEVQRQTSAGAAG